MRDPGGSAASTIQLGKGSVGIMKTRSLLLAILTCLAPASQGAAQVLPGPRGPVEFVGLESWTASDLFEAIQATAPDRPFHACAAVMELDLGFPDAAAFLFIDNLADGSRESYTVVVGVEDSSRVRYRTPGSETVPLPETWQDLQSVAEDDFNTLTSAVYARYLVEQPEAARAFAEHAADRLETTRTIAEQLGADPEILDEVWAFVDRTRGEEDRRLAHEVLARDASWTARAVATMVLGHFPDDNASWHGLALSLIDPTGRVTEMATRTLEGLIRSGKAHPVRWSEARATLVAVLGGTNPWAFVDILEVLVATEVDAVFGRELARERPELLLAHAGAEHERTREPALAFLRAISGEDFGRDVEAWRAWIRGPEREERGRQDRPRGTPPRR